MTMLIPLHRSEGILLLPLTDTLSSPMLWIDTLAQILLLMLKSVLWLLQMGIGRPDGMLTRLCLRTIPLQRQRMKNSANMSAVMLLLVMPFSLLFWAVLVVLALRRRDSCALWLFWNCDSMMLSVTVRAYPRFLLLIALSFALGVFDRRLRESLLLWLKLLLCVLLVLRRSLLLPTFLIASVLPIARALLILFHDAVPSLLPLHSLHPPMPPLFPLFLSFLAFSVDLDCAS